MDVYEFLEVHSINMITGLLLPFRNYKKIETYVQGTIQGSWLDLHRPGWLEEIENNEIAVNMLPFNWAGSEG